MTQNRKIYLPPPWFTPEYVRSILDYDPLTGIFRWKENRGTRVKAGALAGCWNKENGYLIIGFDCDVYKGHRLAWFRNKLGIKGVYLTPSGRVRAIIKTNGVQRRLGTFDTTAEAKAAYDQAANDAHGEFAYSA